MRKTSNFRFLIISAALAFVGGAVYYFGVVAASKRPATVKIDDSVLKVEIADEPAEYQRGLSGRDSLPPDEGMLFVFESPAQPGFWMKDMAFPIDIIWIGADHKIIAITPSLGVDSYPATFHPPEPVVYVLEVNAGISARNGWLVGDLVEFNLNH